MKRLSNLDLSKNELQNALVHKLAAAPGSPTEGQIYYDTVLHVLYFHNGTSWISTQSSGVSYGSPTTSAVGDASADGVATTVARSDHRHAREAFGAVTAQTSFGASSGNGSATTVAHSDHTHGTPAAPTASSVGAVANAGNAGSLQTGLAASKPTSGQAAGNVYIDNDDGLLWIFTNATTSTQLAPFGGAGVMNNVNINGAATAGSLNGYARIDHSHGVGNYGPTVTTETNYGQGSSAGSATTWSRGDHTHGTPSLTANAASTQAIGDTATVGTGTAPARDDHKHAMPGFGAVSAQTTFGGSSANGSATTLAHSDHTHGTPTHDATAHSAISISSLSAPTADVAWASHKITGLLDPTSAQDAATKAYVDAAVIGTEVKPSVRAATTAALTATYANGTAGVGATLTATTNVVLPTIDGVSLSVNDRVLVKDQGTTFQNGIYTVTSLGAAGSAPWVLTRATDSDTSGEVSSGNLTYVESGTTNSGQLWAQTTTGAITMGTTGLVWTQFSGASTLTAGAGLTASGNTFAVGAGTGISVGADTVGIDTAVVTRKYAVAITGGGTSEVITHNLGTQDVTVALYNSASPYDEQDADIEHTSTNTITLRFAVAPSAGALRCVVHG